MSRTELIEIIYALQQEEQSLRRQNEGLKSRLDDRQICMDLAGSIAEAAEEEIKQARREAQRILSEAQVQAEQIRQRGKQAAAKEKEKFQQSVYRLLKQNPELEAALKARAKREDNG